MVLVQSGHSKRVSNEPVRWSVQISFPPGHPPALGRCGAAVQGAGASENSVNSIEHLLCGHGRTWGWMRPYVFEASPLGINKTNTEML